MRCRIILKFPSGSYKVASIYFSPSEPSFYLDFPYLKSSENGKFLATKMLPSSDHTKLVYKRESCFFFDTSPKFSYHLTGQVHIKDPKKNIVPGLITHTTPLDSEEPKSFLDLIIKNPSGCKLFNPAKDLGTEEDKNLIIDSEGLEAETIELRGVRAVLTKENPWFNEVAPNHPILGGRIDIQTGKNIPAIFFCFKPTDTTNRVLFCFEINFQKQFDCDEDQLLYVRSGFLGPISGPEYSELVIMAPRDPARMEYSS